jgi:rhamnosyltransferase
MDTFDLIRQLKKYSSEIIFVSTKISEDYFVKMSKYCKVIRRENYGYDFWSYKVGLESISNKKELHSILFLNNSFIAMNPVKLCEEYFSLNINKDSLFGLTLSNQISRHIQSYWIEFIGPKLINSKDFNDWWLNMIPISNQNDVIIKYEIGLSSDFIKNGYELNALFIPNKDEKLIASMRSITNYHYSIKKDSFFGDNISVNINLAEKLNPTSLLWYELLSRFHFIKFKTMKSSNHDFSKFLLKKYFDGLCEKSKIICENYLADRKISY